MLAKLFPIDDIITWFLDEINEYMYAISRSGIILAF